MFLLLISNVLRASLAAGPSENGVVKITTIIMFFTNEGLRSPIETTMRNTSARTRFTCNDIVKNPQVSNMAKGRKCRTRPILPYAHVSPYRHISPYRHVYSFRHIYRFRQIHSFASVSHHIGTRERLLSDIYKSNA